MLAPLLHSTTTTTPRRALSAPLQCPLEIETEILRHSLPPISITALQSHFRHCPTGPTCAEIARLRQWVRAVTTLRLVCTSFNTTIWHIAQTICSQAPLDLLIVFPLENMHRASILRYATTSQITALYILDDNITQKTALYLHSVLSLCVATLTSFALHGAIARAEHPLHAIQTIGTLGDTVLCQSNADLHFSWLLDLPEMFETLLEKSSRPSSATFAISHYILSNPTYVSWSKLKHLTITFLYPQRTAVRSPSKPQNAFRRLSFDTFPCLEHLFVLGNAAHLGDFNTFLTSLLTTLIALHIPSFVSSPAHDGLPNMPLLQTLSCPALELPHLLHNTSRPIATLKLYLQSPDVAVLTRAAERLNQCSILLPHLRRIVAFLPINSHIKHNELSTHFLPELQNLITFIDNRALDKTVLCFAKPSV